MDTTQFTSRHQFLLGFTYEGIDELHGANLATAEEVVWFRKVWRNSAPRFSNLAQQYDDADLRKELGG